MNNCSFQGVGQVLKLAIFAVLLLGPTVAFGGKNLLNVSYDPTRELYRDINESFVKHWKEKTNEVIEIRQSHGGSGKQARSVIDGLEADVVTLALAYDIDAIAEKTGVIVKDWQKRLPHNSSPYTSTIVFVVRKGNPKNIKDWDDLVKPGVAVITPNPKTSGGARWNYLAAWGYSLRQAKGDQKQAFEFVRRLFKNAPVLDSGARGSTTTFVQRGIGDVLLAWENEALFVVNEMNAANYLIITPSVSILAEPPVALVDKVVEKKGTKTLAQAYLDFLYTPASQEIMAKHFFRPRLEAALAKAKVKFPKVELFTIDDTFGGWAKAQREHFADGGNFDKIFVDDSKKEKR